MVCLYNVSLTLEQNHPNWCRSMDVEPCVCGTPHNEPFTQLAVVHLVFSRIDPRKLGYACIHAVEISKYVNYNFCEIEGKPLDE